MDNIEKKVADTVLQKPYCVQIGEETYKVAPPSIATIILASELIAQLPGLKLDNKQVMFESLFVAKDCNILGEIVATLILGADNLTSEEEIIEKHCFGLIRRKKKVQVDNKAILSDKILKKLSPSKVNTITISILNRMEIGDFFGLTASLIEVNLIRPTKPMEEAEMIVSGQ